MGPAPEPRASATVLAVAGALLAASVLSTRLGARFRIPSSLLFLGIGMLAGEQGVGGIVFSDYHLAYRVGTIALVFILFDGGLGTPAASLRGALLPALSLATAGVAATAGLFALFAHVLGFSWIDALLLGAIVSSTDAAAVFSVLRSSGVRPNPRLTTTLEIESGLNDPLAVILTTVTTTIAAGDADVAALLTQIPIQFAIGGLLGAAFGLASLALLRRMRLEVFGLVPVLSVAFALLAYGVPTLLGGSGFLAVFVAGLVIGHGLPVPLRSELARIHDALAWLSRVGMFLVLGLLAFPLHVLDVAATGIVLGLLLAVGARPLAALACLLPFGFRVRESAWIGWVGLRGAVSIVLATIPVMAGIEHAERIFDVVFFVVAVSAIIPGATVGRATSMLRVGEDPPLAPRRGRGAESPT